MDMAYMVTTKVAPEGVPPVGSRISYEDMANSYKEGTILGFFTTKWSTEAVIRWDGWDDEGNDKVYDSLVTSLSLVRVAQNKHAGFKLVSEPPAV